MFDRLVVRAEPAPSQASFGRCVDRIQRRLLGAIGVPRLTRRPGFPADCSCAVRECPESEPPDTRSRLDQAVVPVVAEEEDVAPSGLGVGSKD